MNILLKNQLKKYFGKDYKLESFDLNFQSFLNDISNSYDDFKKENKLIEQVLEVNSNELYKTNQNLKELNNTLEDRIIKATKNLEEAQKLAKIGSWKLYINSNKLIWSDETYRIFDMKKRSSRSLKLRDFLSTIYTYDGLMLVDRYNEHLENKSEYNIVHRIVTRDKKIKWVEERCETTYDKNDHPLVSIGTIQDITEKKEKEIALQEQEQLLQQQSRLAQMGEMISMIAHQWRQPLGAIGVTTIGIQTKLMLDKYDLSKQNDLEEFKIYLDARLEDINGFVQSLSTTIDDFRNFFKPDKNKENISLIDPINRALKIVKTSMDNKGINIIVDLKNDDKLLIYQNEVMQVILNILKNSEDNFLDIRKRDSNIKNPQIKITTRKNKDKYIIEISDNGGGISDEILPKIFDPYFSTKDEKNGTGLGLYMSKIIIEEHNNGKLNVENTKEGVLFKIELKVCDE